MWLWNPNGGRSFPAGREMLQSTDVVDSLSLLHYDVVRIGSFSGRSFAYNIFDFF